MEKGNCIDRFIERRLNKSLNNIMVLRLNIKNRKYIRSVNPNYFSTGCYEKDFSDIRKIKEEAELLVTNCNKFLERISEQYSKLE
jgi:hypothetical protein